MWRLMLVRMWCNGDMSNYVNIRRGGAAIGPDEMPIGESTTWSTAGHLVGPRLDDQRHTGLAVDLVIGL